MIKILGDKRGVHWSIIAGLVLLVLSTVFLVLFWSRISGSDIINRETCHQSIVQRDLVNLGALQLSKSVVPLKCTTEKICLSDSNSYCVEQFGANSNINGKDAKVTRIVMDSKKQSPKEAILEAFANAIYDCNNVLGGGKINFMPYEMSEKNYCLICSRIVLDPSFLTKAPKSISQKELFEYMASKKNSAGQSYLDVVYNVSSPLDMEKSMQVTLDAVNKAGLEKAAKNNENYVPVTMDSYKIDLTTPTGTAIYAQIVPKSTWGMWGSTAGVTTAGLAITTILVGAILAIPTGGTSLVVGAVMVGTIGVTTTGVAATAVTFKTMPDGASRWQAPTVVPYDSDHLGALNCYSFETAP